MERDLGVTLALERWQSFLAAYAAVEPGNALDLEGDPPIYIALLKREHEESQR